MDSLTQIVLGASMGEMVAGRKIGNRAMLWGAIAGTIPDLDVFGGLFGMSPEEKLAFHRGISHSFFFAVLAPLVLGFATQYLYKHQYHNKPIFRQSTAIAGMLFLLLCVFILNAFPYFLTEQLYWPLALISIALMLFFSYRLWNKYALKDQESVELPLWRWYLLYFIAIVTHPLLDSCTGYGTQLFQPFSDVRISWDNISVADPFYTLPFLFLLIASATRNKSNSWRSILNIAAFSWSMLYMGWTVCNKHQVNTAFEHTIESKGLSVDRYMSTPTILNNFLWHCVAEGEDVFYDGFYSIYDKQKTVDLVEVPKRHDLLLLKDDKRVQTIDWFSNGYYSVIPLEGDTLQINDMRYGRYLNGAVDNPKAYVFTFEFTSDGERYFMKEQTGRPDISIEEFWNSLIDRIKGK